MTTIATDGKTIAADTAFFSGQLRLSGSCQKTIQRGGHIFAWAGHHDMAPAWIDWFLGGQKREDIPINGNDDDCISLLVAMPDGSLKHGNLTAKFPYIGTVYPPFAIGSGREFALGAMSMGASPEEAVKIAMKHDIYTGGDVVVVDIEQPRGQVYAYIPFDYRQNLDIRFPP